MIKKLGKGAYASVKLVKRKIDGEIYALKMVKLPRLSKRGIINFPPFLSLFPRKRKLS